MGYYRTNSDKKPVIKKEHPVPIPSMAQYHNPFANKPISIIAGQDVPFANQSVPPDQFSQPLNPFNTEISYDSEEMKRRQQQQMLVMQEKERRKI